MTTAGRVTLRKFDSEAPVSSPLFIIEAVRIQEAVSTSLARSLKFSLNGHFSFDGKLVFAMSENDVVRLLTAIDYVVINRTGTSKENVEHLTIAPSASVDTSALQIVGNFQIMPSNQFEIQNFGSNRNSFAYIAGRTLPALLQRKVLLTSAKGHHKVYSKRGAFQVNIWSSTREEYRMDNKDAPKTIFGTPVRCRNYPFRPTRPYLDEVDSGVFIMEGNYAVAELLPNALYIHHDLAGYGNAEAFELLKRILIEATRLLADTDELHRRRTATRKIFDEEQEKLFEGIVGRSIPRQFLRNEAALRTAEELSARLLREYFVAERTAFGLRNAAMNKSAAIRRFTSEFRKLKEGSVANVNNITLTQSEEGVLVNVFTDVITVDHPDTRDTHLIGRFQIVFDLVSAVEVRFLNLDRSPESTCFHAPHVNEEGYPCLGNIESDLLAYIANFEIEAAVTLAVAYLQSVDVTDGWGQNIVDYPVIKTRASAA